MGSWTIAHYHGDLNMPHITQVGEHTEWRVCRTKPDGKEEYVAVSSERIARENAELYVQRGYKAVHVEYRIVQEMGEIPW